jgi:hypothetical protein
VSVCFHTLIVLSAEPLIGVLPCITMHSVYHHGLRGCAPLLHACNGSNLPFTAIVTTSLVPQYISLGIASSSSASGSASSFRTAPPPPSSPTCTALASTPASPALELSLPLPLAPQPVPLVLLLCLAFLHSHHSSSRRGTRHRHLL